MKQEIAHDRNGQPCARNIIETPEDRQAHIESCKKQDTDSPWGLVQNPQHYENVGDIASVNSWYYHDRQTGFEKLYANTPDWILDLAARLKWVSERGEKVLS